MRPRDPRFTFALCLGIIALGFSLLIICQLLSHKH